MKYKRQISGICKLPRLFSSSQRRVLREDPGLQMKNEPITMPDPSRHGAVKDLWSNGVLQGQTHKGELEVAVSITTYLQ